MDLLPQPRMFVTSFGQLLDSLSHDLSMDFDGNRVVFHHSAGSHRVSEAAQV